MYNVIKIGDTDVPMLAMASCDVYYRNIFHEDPIKVQAGKNPEEGDLINLFLRMGFVMAKFAELKDRKEMNKLTEDMYLDWLDQFDHYAYIDALADIRATYEGQAVAVSEAKKKDGKQNDR